MNEAVAVGAIAMLGSTALIVVIALSAAAILAYCEKRVGHTSSDH